MHEEKNSNIDLFGKLPIDENERIQHMYILTRI